MNVRDPNENPEKGYLRAQLLLIEEEDAVC
jgi:hypothetical protein